MKIHLISFVVFILTFSLTETTFSQKKDNGDDVYNTSKPIADGSNYSFVDDTEFGIDNFVKGYIILATNVVQYGLIKFNGNVVVFKDTLTKKNKRYNAQELNGFITQADTLNKSLKPNMKFRLFIQLNYQSKRKTPLENGINGMQIRIDTFKVLADSFMVKFAGGHAAPGDKLVHNNKFIRQEIYGANVCLYKITERYNNAGSMMNGAMMTGGSYLKNTFYLKRKNETQYTLIPERKKPFKKFAAEYLKNNPQLVLDIEQEKLTYNNIDDIVLRYNNTK